MDQGIYIYFSGKNIIVIHKASYVNITLEKKLLEGKQLLLGENQALD